MCDRAEYELQEQTSGVWAAEAEPIAVPVHFKPRKK